MASATAIMNARAATTATEAKLDGGELCVCPLCMENVPVREMRIVTWAPGRFLCDDDAALLCATCANKPGMGAHTAIACRAPLATGQRALASPGVRQAPYVRCSNCRQPTMADRLIVVGFMRSLSAADYLAPNAESKGAWLLDTACEACERSFSSGRDIGIRLVPGRWRTDDDWLTIA
jgi:hypothetical protein